MKINIYGANCDYMIKNNNENAVLRNILSLLKVKGVRQKDLAEHLGISQNAITQWKMHKTKSYMNYLDQISDYLNVTKDELLLANNKAFFESYLSVDEQQIVHDYRLLNDTSKTAVMNLIHTLADNWQ